MATVACVGTALSRDEFERLLEGTGFQISTVESRRRDAVRLAQRVKDRLREMRVLGLGDLAGLGVELDEAVELTSLALAALDDGTLDYAIFAAAR